MLKSEKEEGEMGRYCICIYFLNQKANISSVINLMKIEENKQ